MAKLAYCRSSENYLYVYDLQVVCREDMLTLRQSNVNPSDTCLFGGPSTNIHQPKIGMQGLKVSVKWLKVTLPLAGFLISLLFLTVSTEHEVGARAAVSLPFMAQPSNSVNISRQYQSQGDCCTHPFSNNHTQFCSL